MHHTNTNIVLIMTDQLRADALGCYGNPVCITPNINRLAESGVRFDRAYTVCPVCSPARASMLTGLYPHNHRVMLNTHIDTSTVKGLNPEIPTFSESLKGLGYHLEYFGKWHVHEELDPLHYGFNRYTTFVHPDMELCDKRYIEFINGKQLISAKTALPIEKEPSYILAKSVERFLTERSMNKDDPSPFFVRCDFTRPHFPSIVPEPFASMYDAKDINPWPNFHEENFSNKPAGHLRKHREWALEDKEWNWWSKTVAMYYADISYLDHCCGVILDALESTGLDKDTMVVFTSDHADSMGSHRHFEKGGTMYEEVLRIPFIVRWPCITKAGRIEKNFVRNMDLMPTFIKAAGGEPPEGIDGIDIGPLLGGEAEPERWLDSVYAEYNGSCWGAYTQRMVRTDSFKYVYNPYDLDELYDLKNDPYELQNQISNPAYSEVLKEMQARFYGWVRQSKDKFTYHFVTRNLPEPIYPMLP